MHFIRLCFQNVGIDKGDIPDLTKAPSSLLDALEGHLATLEGRKSSAANTPTQSSRYTIANSLNNNHRWYNLRTSTYHISFYFNLLSSAFGAPAGRNDQYGNGIDESIKQQALAEEEAAMNQYKVRTTPRIKVAHIACANI